MDKLVKKLTQISLFRDLHRGDALAHLASLGKVVPVRKDQVIFLEGDPGETLYVPLSGTYEILKKTQEGDTYTVSKLDASLPVFFGELSLIDDERRSATVVATEEGECFVLSKAAFEHFMKEHPDWALVIVREIARILANRLRKTTQDMLTIFNALVEEIKD